MARPRLLAMLADRFRRRLTVVVAGPGFGKTSLLAQARAENLLAPRGEDVWLTCARGDSTASRLARGLQAALGLPGADAWDGPAHEVAGLVAAEVWRRSPLQVALLLDDAHLLPARSPGAALITELLERLPSNGHLVLSGRPPLPVSGARLASAGQLAEIDEGDLAFSAAELAEFAQLRDVPVELLGESGRWPALAELTASTGEHRVLDYLGEELLAEMPPLRRRLLAMVALVGGADEEVAAALAEAPVDLPALLSGLPLVSESSGGTGTWRSLHPLWQPALARELPVPEQAPARRRAAAVLRARGDVDAALRLYAQAEDWAAVRGLIRETAAQVHPVVAPDVLAEWYSWLPPPMRDAAEGLLLRGVVDRSRSLPSAVVSFEAAAGRFRTDGDRAGELAALIHLCHIRWCFFEAEALAAAVARLEELAADWPDITAQVQLWHVFLADARAEWSVALERLAAIPSSATDPLSSYVHWLRAWQLLWLGRSQVARTPAELAVAGASGTFVSAALNVRLLASWLSGDVGEAVRDLPGQASATAGTGRTLAQVFERAVCALVLAYLGEAEGARDHLTAAASALPECSGAPMAQRAHNLAEVAVLLAEGSEEQARQRLAAELAACPLPDTRLARLHLLFPALSYVLAPETRTCWDENEPDDALRARLRLAAAVVAARETGSLHALAGLDLSSPGFVRASLPLPWAVELAVAATAAGRPEGRELLGALGPAARRRLRELATVRGRRPLARAARELAAGWPPTPTRELEVSVLGPLELRRAGELVTHADLQRERVRQLLLYMVAHRTATRQAVAAELWPDLEPEVAAHNLRVTLSYTQRLLEPDRADGDPPFFLRADPRTLRLVTGGWLSVDAWRLDRLLDEAADAERQGAISVALRAYQEALPLYRGDYLSDVPYADWAVLERDRLRLRYVAAAVRAGELLLATGDHEAPLVYARAALRVARWSEEAHRLLIATHLERDELSAARLAFAQCQQALAELGVAPDPRTEIVARRLAALGGAAGTARARPVRAGTARRSV